MVGSLRKALDCSLHSHHMQTNGGEGNLWGRARPDVVASCRGGSNCGYVPLERSLDFYLIDRDAPFIGVTDHSRDGQQEKSRDNVAGLFYEQCLEHPDWLRQVFGYELDSQVLTAVEEAQLRQYCLESATRLIMYGDERLQNNLDRIAASRQRYPGKRIFAGVEVNLLPDGSIDTSMVERGFFEDVVLSLHPNVAEAEFAGVMSNPLEYTRFMIQAIRQFPAQILAHPGFEGVLVEDRKVLEQGQITPLEAERRYRLAIDWEWLGAELQTKGMALEINFSPQHKYLCRTAMKAGDDWQTGWEEVIQQVPLIESAAEIGYYLRPSLRRGLLLTINNDSHEVPAVELMKDRGDRWDEAMGCLAEMIGQGLTQLGAPVDQVINTWSVDRLERFFDR